MKKNRAYSIYHSITHSFIQSYSLIHSLTQSLSHSPSLFDAPGTEAFASELLFLFLLLLFSIFGINDPDRLKKYAMQRSWNGH